MTTYNNPNDKQYFNLHLEGFANLYDARMVTPKQGQSFTPFLQIRAAFLQGKADNAQPVFVDLKPTGKKAIAIIERFQSELADKDVKVRGALKVGDIRMSIGGGKDGQAPRIFTSARLLSIKHLNVGGKVIDLSQFDQATPAGNQYQSQSAASNSKTHIIPDAVTLDPEAPGFDKRKAELRAAGYTWDRNQEAWIAPQGNTANDEKPENASDQSVVKLDKSAPDFEVRKDELKSKGYRWDRDQQAWVAPKAA